RRVGEVALPARYRQLPGEERQQRVRDAQVAFGVLELDRIDLVRHRRGADLARDDARPEVAETDVTPDVPAQVDQHGVEARERLTVLRDPVVRLDLGRVSGRLEPERGHEPFADAEPVRVRIGGDVRVEVADRTVELAERLDARKLLLLTR